MAAYPIKSCHEMEGDQNKTPTEVFKEDLMGIMTLEQDGTQSILPSSLEGFQVPSSTYTLLDMDLSGSFDLRPPLSPSSQPSLGVTGFMDTLTFQQLSEMISKQYQSLKDTFSTEIGQLKHAIDTFTLNMNTASVKQTTEITQLMSNQFEHFRKEFNNMQHGQLKNHHTEVLKDFNAVMEPMANTLAFIQKASDRCTQQINIFISETSSNSNLQDELHQCTQHFHKLALDMEAFKSSQLSSVKANANNYIFIPFNCGGNSGGEYQITVTPFNISKWTEFNPINESATAEGRGCFMGKQPIKIKFPLVSFS